MTFDARQSVPKGGKSDLWFGAGVFVCASVMFSAIMSLPETPTTLTDYASTSSVAAVSNAQIVRPASLSTDLKSFLETVEAVDPGASLKLAVELNALADTGKEREVFAVTEGLRILEGQSNTLRNLPVSEIDTMLEMTRNAFWQAIRDESPACEGAGYAHLLQTKGLTADSLSHETQRLAPAMSGFGLETVAFLLERTAIARALPEPHTEMTNVDRAALEGVLMSIASDEQIVPVLIAQQTGQTTEDALKDLNICELGVTAVTAVKTLPQDTKGRTFRYVLETLPEVDHDLAALLAKMRL